jgi:hypothetical protein
MSKETDAVKRVTEELRSWAQRNRDADRHEAAQRIEAMVLDLQGVSEELIRLANLTTALPPDLDDIHDLPEELLAELSVLKTDEIEDQIVTVVNSYGGSADLDRILVGLFRKFGVSQKRRFIQNKLYRMDMIWSVDGRKGVYTTQEPSIEAEIEEIDWDDADEIPDEVPF